MVILFLFHFLSNTIFNIKVVLPFLDNKLMAFLTALKELNLQPNTKSMSEATYARTL